MLAISYFSNVDNNVDKSGYGYCALYCFLGVLILFKPPTCKRIKEMSCSQLLVCLLNFGKQKNNIAGILLIAYNIVILATNIQLSRSIEKYV